LNLNPLRRERLHIAPEFAPILSEAGIDSFHQLMAEPLGTVVHSKPGSEVRRVELFLAGMQSVFYLKRTLHEPLGKALQQIRHGLRPHVTCFREVLPMQLLHDHAFAVARVAAWGEWDVFGLPRQGFLLTDEVLGDGLHHALAAATPKARAMMLAAAGHYVGRLHRAGFYHNLRLRDFVCQHVCSGGMERYGLVLIDRDLKSASPYPQPCSREQCLGALARIAYLMIRTNYPTRKKDTVRFMRSYLRAIGPICDGDMRAILRDTGRFLAVEIDDHSKDSQRVARFGTLDEPFWRAG
jgi:hypothetical protein